MVCGLFVDGLYLDFVIDILESVERAISQSEEGFHVFLSFNFLFICN